MEVDGKVGDTEETREGRPREGQGSAVTLNLLLISSSCSSGLLL